MCVKQLVNRVIPLSHLGHRGTHELTGEFHRGSFSVKLLFSSAKLCVTISQQPKAKSQQLKANPATPQPNPPGTSTSKNRYALMPNR